MRIELQRLVFRDFALKKSRLRPGLFFVFFRVFLKGVWGKLHFRGGAFVVKLWSIRGELWFADDRFVDD